ncbi:5-aminolevulic acid synthase [Rhodobacterales bacterium HKCCE3408]|nr:5-aminolevulic acid synthase [Rhodobacterales bacterium HKCCE3408]
MRAFIGIILAAGLTAPALAQDLPGRREALRMVFEGDAPVESVVFPDDSLNPAELQLLSNAVSQGLMPEMRYYGAIAIAPDRGLADPQTTTAVGNFHDADSASAAALARCNDARDEDEAECVLVLVVRPAGWSAGAPLQLSSGAAEALRRDFRGGRPRYFAISPASGQFGMGGSESAANADCGYEDCRVVVAED